MIGTAATPAPAGGGRSAGSSEKQSRPSLIRSRNSSIPRLGPSERSATPNRSLSGTYRGVDAIVDQFLGGAAGLMAPGTQVTIELVSAIADGDRVAAEWTSRATSRNGTPYHNRNVGIFTVHDG